MGRRIVFRKSPAAAARRRILYTSPAPYLLDGGPDWDTPMSSAVFDVLVKAAAELEGSLTPECEAQAHASREALGKAADAMAMGKPVPLESRWAAWQVFENQQAK